ncbi:MAG TPA: DNA mismatch repair protein MutS, partial [Candidatus Eisenbacteria bacterium]|nr:DNA mismatch repair protein MutS [Candidatus Eisenbacteria bacterium]
METPMLEQYRRLKAEHPGSILLFRMGDFYETFGDDALVASRVLGIALTTRDKKRDPIPLAGVPHHSVEGYLKKLVQEGYSVAIAEQMEPPGGVTKGIMERQVIEVVTPGTVTRPGLLDTFESNYIVAVLPGPDRTGVAVAEVSTGEFRVGEVAPDALEALAIKFPAREVLLPEADRPGRNTVLAGVGPASACDGDGAMNGAVPFHAPRVTRWESARFDPSSGRTALERRFQVRTLESFGLGVVREGYGAAGALLDYLRSLKKSDLPQIREARPLRAGRPLVVDDVTLRNLEVLTSEAGPEHTLLALLDRTESSMGARALRSLLRAPASEREVLEPRLDRTQCFASSAPLRTEMRDRLHRFPDLERCLGLIGSGRATPRDLGSLRDALRRLPAVRLTLEARADEVLGAWRRALPDLSTLSTALEGALAEELPQQATQGGIIRPGYDAELDRLRGEASDVRERVLALEARERERTGISNLRVLYHRVFGYLIEVTKSQLSRVPDDYVRRQTLAGAERFVTSELSHMEERIEAASVESHRLETAHFQRLRDLALEAMDDLHAAARVIAEIDLFLSLGDVASRERWVRPALVDEGTLRLKRARHPMVERSIPPGGFQPNDCSLDTATEQIWLITGPNMGGKSTFLRQVGLCVYLAQIGSFVPAESATVGLADRIFTRVGASDQIARGASTFFVEMRETATILRQATDRSVVLLDEVGRGTSTYDGLSLAWAVTEALHDGERGRPRTLFATHYHELTELEDRLPRLRNRTVRVAEERGEIVFLHQIGPGRADRSYGIHVAQLAGVPEPVLRRARELLHDLEQGR